MGDIMAAETALDRERPEIPSHVETLSAYEEQISRNRLRNQRLLESLGVRQCRAVLSGRSCSETTSEQPEHTTESLPTRGRRARRSVKAQAVAVATVRTRSQRRTLASSTETDAESMNLEDKPESGSRSFEAFALTTLRPSEKSPPSLGRYAFWEPVHQTQVSVKNEWEELMTKELVPRPPVKMPWLPVVSKKRVISEKSNQLEGKPQGGTAAERRIRKRKAFESRFCADLPREPAPYALRCVLEPRMASTCCSTVVTPFTLLSIGVTVQNLGQLVVQPNEPFAERRWFSSRLAMYAHPLPRGYHATKMHWNRLWHMHIEADAGSEGPIFIVRSDDGKECYQRHTPSHAWMDACLNSHAPGTRISGPLFYGFSDPWLQRVIQTQLVADAKSRLKANGIQDQRPFMLGVVRDS